MKASPRVMEDIACPMVVMVSPSMAPSQVTMGKKATALTISTMMGKSMSIGFAVSSPSSSSVPEAGPYFSALNRIPCFASSSDCRMGPKSRFRKMMVSTITSASRAYRL